MPTYRHLPIAIALFLAPAFTVGPASAQQLPAAIDAPGMTKIVTLYAIGAQIFECKAGNDGKLAWAGREPIAALTLDGKTVGRHYAGPSWEHTDGSIVVGKAVGNAPGKSPNDAAWLKLEVTSHKGDGILIDRDHHPARQHAGRRLERQLRQGGRLEERRSTPPITSS